jgi:hypothetical protein
MVAPVLFIPWTTTATRSGRATTPITVAQAPNPSLHAFASVNMYQEFVLDNALMDNNVFIWLEVLLSQHTPATGVSDDDGGGKAPPPNDNMGISTGNDKGLSDGEGNVRQSAVTR